MSVEVFGRGRADSAPPQSSPLPAAPENRRQEPSSANGAAEPNGEPISKNGGGAGDLHVLRAQATPGPIKQPAENAPNFGPGGNSDSDQPGSEKRAYPAPAEVPTQEGPNGLRFDFNDGCRLVMPPADHPWRVRLTDIDTGNILFETEIKTGRVNSTKRYFVRFRIEAWMQDEQILSHDYDATNREILIQFPVGTLGDTVGWLSYAANSRSSTNAS